MKLRDLRIVPIMLIAAASLAVLKLTGILLERRLLEPLAESQGGGSARRPAKHCDA